MKIAEMLVMMALVALALAGCGDDKTAGTVTDTGNTIASETRVTGLVRRVDGTPATDAMVRMARMATFDSVLHIPEQVEVATDSNGLFAFDSALADTFQLVVIDTSAIEVFYLPRTTLQSKAIDSIQLAKAAVLSSVLYYEDVAEPAVPVGAHFVACLTGTPFCQSVFAADSFAMLIPEGTWGMEFFPGDPQIVAKLLESGIADSLVYRSWKDDLKAKSGDNLKVGPFMWSTTTGVDSLIKESEKEALNVARLTGTVFCKKGNLCADVEVMMVKDIYGFDFVDGDSLEFVVQTTTDSTGRWWLPLPDSLPGDTFRIEFRKLQDGLVTQSGVSRYLTKKEVENLKDTLDVGTASLERPSILVSGVSLVVNREDSTQSSNCMVNSVVVGIKGTSHFVRDVTCNELTLADLPAGDQEIVLYSGDPKIMATLKASLKPILEFVTLIDISLTENSTQQKQWMTYTPPSQNNLK